MVPVKRNSVILQLFQEQCDGEYLSLWLSLLKSFGNWGMKQGWSVRMKLIKNAGEHQQTLFSKQVLSRSLLVCVMVQSAFSNTSQLLSFGVPSWPRSLAAFLSNGIVRGWRKGALTKTATLLRLSHWTQSSLQWFGFDSSACPLLHSFMAFLWWALSSSGDYSMIAQRNEKLKRQTEPLLTWVWQLLSIFLLNFWEITSFHDSWSFFFFPLVPMALFCHF